MQLLRKLLFPISLIYGLVVFLRNKLYDWGIFTSMSFSTRTICIGNLSVGGTGKTPMTELLIRSLSPQYKVAMLSRGYKRKSSGFVLATDTTSVQELGDEPYQIFTKFPNSTVAVDVNRRNGIKHLEANIKPDVILLDDAFQHRKIKPDFSILLTTYDNLYTDDWYLPTGDLRDAKNSAERADCIIITKCPETLSDTEQITIQKKISPKEHQMVLYAYLSYGDRAFGVQGSLTLDDFKAKKVTLVTGIANPKPLVSYLENNGIIFEHLAFKDHHFFTQKEMELLRGRECILTTEKDYVRLKEDLENLYFLPVSHSFFGDGNAFLDKRLEQLMNR